MKKTWIFLGLAAAMGWASSVHGRDVEGIVLAYHDVLVSAPAQNKLIVSVTADEGETVQEGQVLAKLEAKLEELEVERLAKILEKREFENTAASSLVKEKFISKDEALERSLELDIARIQLEAAREKLTMLSIKSPIDGVILDRVKDVGESVSDSQPEPFFRIVDTSRVYFQCFLGRDLVWVEQGDSLQVTLPVRGEDGEETQATVPGLVQYAAAAYDGSSGLRRIKLLIENADQKIVSGVRGTVEVAERASISKK